MPARDTYDDDDMTPDQFRAAFAEGIPVERVPTGTTVVLRELQQVLPGPLPGGATLGVPAARTSSGITEVSVAMSEDALVGELLPNSARQGELVAQA